MAEPTPSAILQKGCAPRQPIPSDIKAQIVERLSAAPLTNYSELAVELGVSHDVVGRIARRLAGKPEDQADRQATRLVRQIGKRLSVTDRAMVYETLVRGTCNPKAGFVQKAALQRIEELEGIVTAKEKREVSDTGPVQPQIGFVLPGDTNVDIGVAIRVRRKA